MSLLGCVDIFYSIMWFGVGGDVDGVWEPSRKKPKRYDRYNLSVAVVYKIIQYCTYTCTYSTPTVLP